LQNSNCKPTIAKQRVQSSNHKTTIAKQHLQDNNCKARTANQNCKSALDKQQVLEQLFEALRGPPSGQRNKT